MKEKYRLSELMDEIRKDEEVKKQDMNRKLSQDQIRKMLKEMKKK
ncbi:hypothetical protein LZ24_02045 [Desulfobotulus alkaliphilus]|uniref:Uncharacterized protein n=1 Tax=Desulfobotulus alkaliphilus TaxID=622671 RepID=A0A562RQ66_9BACT|nr:hypothetical protein [Desulfobotulus alkaliphilus]TWI71245.1 hypothetical protein LZ24_02045 [Desulfobotulus alkaliphilus]